MKVLLDTRDLKAKGIIYQKKSFLIFILFRIFSCQVRIEVASCSSLDRYLGLQIKTKLRVCLLPLEKA